MRQVFIKTPENTVSLEEVHATKPIFARNEDGELCGMIIHEKDGWIVKVGGSCGSYGHRGTRRELIEYGILNMRYTFHVDF